MTSPALPMQGLFKSVQSRILNALDCFPLGNKRLLEQYAFKIFDFNKLGFLKPKVLKAEETKGKQKKDSNLRFEKKQYAFKILLRTDLVALTSKGHVSLAC